MLDDLRPGRAAWRLVRSVAVAEACVLTAVAAHRVGGGEAPGAAVVPLLLAAVATVWAVGRRRVTFGQTVGLLVLCQVVVHVACSGDEMVMGGSMLALHAAATVGCAALVARGERWAWALAEHLGVRAHGALRALPVPLAMPPLVVASPSAATSGPDLAVRPTRGPPRAI